MNTASISCDKSSTCSTFDEILADPTLESCCRRDIEAQKRTASLTATLRSCDRINLRSDMKNQVIGISKSGIDHDEVFDDDPDLARLMRSRLEEMKRDRQQERLQQAQGYGQLTQMASQDFLKDLAADIHGPCVCHVAFEGSEICDLLDELLSSLAHRYPCTRFIRLAPRHGPQSSSLKASLGLNTIPAIVCFRDGSIVARAYLELFGSPAELIEEQVVSYLRHLAVLQSEKSVSQASSSDDEKDPSSTGRDTPPCDVCGRRYPHEHIRSVYRTGVDISSDEEQVE